MDFYFYWRVGEIVQIYKNISGVGDQQTKNESTAELASVYLKKFFQYLHQFYVIPWEKRNNIYIFDQRGNNFVYLQKKKE